MREAVCRSGFSREHPSIISENMCHVSRGVGRAVEAFAAKAAPTAARPSR